MNEWERHLRSKYSEEVRSCRNEPELIRDMYDEDSIVRQHELQMHMASLLANEETFWK